MSADPGAVIAERFEVRRVIGQGGNGVVCEVLDRSTGLLAALKMLAGDDPELAGRIEREGRALGMLAHPHIVAFVDAGEDNEGRPFVVTEMIEGISLREVLQQGPLAPRRALGIVRQLLEALDAVHGAGIIHRDVKPENIMLAAGGQPGRDYAKLIDFGATKVMDLTSNALGAEKLTQAGLEVIGSPRYIAPETAVGQPVDGRTDSYAVGIVLFEMLAGHVPFDHEDVTTLLRMHLTTPIPALHVAAPDGTSAHDLEAIVTCALAKNPAERFQSAMAMHAAIDHVCSLEAAPPSGVTFAMRARQFKDRVALFARQHPKRFAGIATGFVVMVVFLAILSSGGSSSEKLPDKAEPPPPPVVVAKPPGPPPLTAEHWIEQAESEIARRRYGRAISAYERALAMDRARTRDAKLRSGVVQVVEGDNIVAGVIALEVLATRLEPPDQKTIIAQASAGKLAEVRRRAFAIAEREGFDQSIDRFASWSLDLKQPLATCEDRRETITKLRDLGDPRVIDVLKRVRVQFACVAKEADAAVAHLQSK